MADELASLTRIHERLVSTTNEKLEPVLNSLLPKLIPLANKDELRDKVVQILSLASRRAKSVNVVLPLPPLLELVDAAHMPFACNLAISFLDFSMEQCPDSLRESSAKSLIQSMQSYPQPFSPQSDALCFYSLRLLTSIATSVQANRITPTETIPTIASAVLGDYLLDVSMLSSRNPLQKDAAGSIQRGLSDVRTLRLTSKRSLWSPGDIKSAKMRIIDSLSCNWLPPVLSIVIAIANTCDLDQSVAQQAVYKVNGARSMYQIDGKEVSIIRPLLQLCSTMTPQSVGTVVDGIAICSKRSTLRQDIRAEILNFITKELSNSLRESAKETIAFIFAEILRTSRAGAGGGDLDGDSVGAVKLKGMIMRLGISLAEHCDEESLKSVSILLMQCVKKCLATFSVGKGSGSSGSDGSINRGERDMSVRVGTGGGAAMGVVSGEDHLRKACYEIISALARRKAPTLAKDTDLLLSLFKLLESEKDSIVNYLHTALGNLRQNFEMLDENIIASKTGGVLIDLIKRTRASPHTKSRLLSLQWARSMFGWAELSIETMTMLCTDTSELVSQAATMEFYRLKCLFRTGMNSENVSSTGGAVDTTNAGSPPSTAEGSSEPILDSAEYDEVASSQHFNDDALLGALRSILSVLASPMKGTSTTSETKSGGSDSEDSIVGMKDVDTAGAQLLECAFLATTALLKAHYNRDIAFSRPAFSVDPFLQARMHPSPAGLDLIMSPLLQNVAKSFVAMSQWRFPIDEKRGAIVDLDSPSEVMPSTDSAIRFIRNGLILCGHDDSSAEGPYGVCKEKLTSILLQWLSHTDESSSKFIGQALAMCCINGDANYIALLLRSLSMRLNMVDALVTVTNTDSGAAASSRESVNEATLSSLRGVRGSMKALWTIIKSFVTFHTDGTGKCDASSGKSICNAMKSLFALLSMVITRTSEDKSLTGPTRANATATRSEELLRQKDDLVMSIRATCIEIFGSYMQENVSQFRKQHAKCPSSSGAGNRDDDDDDDDDDDSKGTLIANILALTDHKHPDLALAAYKALSLIATSHHSYPSGEQFSRYWKMLRSKGLWQREMDSVQRFSVAEAVCRLPLCSKFASVLDVDKKFADSTDRHTATILYMICVTEQVYSTGNSREKSLAAAVLLVLMVQISKDDEWKKALSAETALRATEMFLRFLQENDVTVQDIACLGLCRVFDIAQKADAMSGLPVDGSHEGSPSTCVSSDTKVEKSLAPRVAKEVIMTLTREKKVRPPPGVGVAGEDVGTSVEGDAARMIERILAGRADDADGDDRGRRGGGAGRGANAGRGGQGGRGGGAGRGAGNNNNNNESNGDALLAAAATAATELGISREQMAAAAGAGGNTNTNAESYDSGYGIYTTTCKVAKKAGDPSIVFAVLTLVRRDPSFGAAGSDSFEFFECYKAPEISIDTAKVKDLLPMLLLAKFDPSPTIKGIMQSLWKKLITEKKLEHLLITLQHDIIKYLNSNLVSRNWRDRESACLALENFLVRRTWETIRPHLGKLWDDGFRMLDDIRDSGRVAAMALMKVLAEHVLRRCDVTDNSAATVDEAVEFVIPKLLKVGLLAPTVEGKGFSFGVLNRLVKGARSRLRHWRPQLVSVLVECMSAFEPQMLQYMQFHTTRLQISEEELEAMRLKVSQQSPMQESLDACLQSLDATVLPEVIHELSGHLHRGVGLATRVAAVQSLSYLAETHPEHLGLHGNKAFRSIAESLVHSPYMAVTLLKTLVGGLGTLAKVVSPSVVVDTSNYIIDQYETLHRDQLDSTTSSVIASCLNQIISRASDRISDDDLWMRVLATSYVGTFEPEAEPREAWTKTWTEALSGSGTGAKSIALLKTLPSIVTLVERLFGDLSWKRRTHAVAVLNDLVASLLPQQLAPNISVLVECLLRTIPGQIWTGQGRAVEALSVLITKCTHHIDMQASQDTVMFSAVDGAVLLTLEDCVHKSRSDETSSAAAGVKWSASKSDDAHGKKGLLPQWRVSIRGLLALLLTESGRGDRDYKHSVARALASLPWRNISSANLSAYLEVLPMLIQRAEARSSAYETSDAAKAAAVTAAVHDDGTNLKLSQLKLSKKSGKQRQAAYASMFGSRYGTPAAATSSTAGSALKKAKQSHSPGQADEGKPGAGSADDIVDTDKENTKMDVDPAVGANTTEGVSETDVHVEVNDQVSGDSSDVGDKLEDSSVASVGDTNTPAALSSLPSSSSEKTMSSDPAYRLKFVECIYQGWPQADLKSESFLQDVSVHRSELVRWCLLAVTREVWSLKRVALTLLGDLVATLNTQSAETCVEKMVASYGEGGNVDIGKLEIPSSFVPSQDGDHTELNDRDFLIDFGAVIKAIFLGVQDSKYSKLRTAALQALDKIARSSWIASLTPSLRRVIAKVMKKCCEVITTAVPAETSSDVLDALAKLKAAMDRASM